MAYAIRSDVEDLFGINNVKKWADLDNDDVDAKIDARITAALNAATERIDARLRGGPYEIPFTATYPPLIVELTAKEAGIWLHNSRVSTDFDPDTGEPIDTLSHHRKDVNRMIRGILAGQVRLDKTDVDLAYPIVVETELE